MVVNFEAIVLVFGYRNIIFRTPSESLQIFTILIYYEFNKSDENELHKMHQHDEMFLILMLSLK